MRILLSSFSHDTNDNGIGDNGNYADSGYSEANNLNRRTSHAIKEITLNNYIRSDVSFHIYRKKVHVLVLLLCSGIKYGSSSSSSLSA